MSDSESESNEEYFEEFLNKFKEAVEDDTKDIGELKVILESRFYDDDDDTDNAYFISDLIKIIAFSNRNLWSLIDVLLEEYEFEGIKQCQTCDSQLDYYANENLLQIIKNCPDHDLVNRYYKVVVECLEYIYINVRGASRMSKYHNASNTPAALLKYALTTDKHVLLDENVKLHPSTRELLEKDYCKDTEGIKELICIMEKNVTIEDNLWKKTFKQNKFSECTNVENKLYRLIADGYNFSDSGLLKIAIKNDLNLELIKVIMTEEFLNTKIPDSYIKLSKNNTVQIMIKNHNEKN